MELPVLFDDHPVATISSDGEEATLTYHPEWLAAPGRFPVSPTMPVDEQPYPTKRVFPWLMNLLPEGEPLRAMSRVLGTSSEDILGLILETGNDLAGALSIAPRNMKGQPSYPTIPDDAALETIIAELPARPFLVDEEGVSMSLAGAQGKLPVHWAGRKISIPVNGAPSTHILKPDNARLPGSVQNEALCI